MAKILIEGNNLFGDRTGIGQYSKRLLENLFAIDKQNSYTIFAFLFLGRGINWPIPRTHNVSYRIIRLLPGRVYRRLMRKGLAPNINLVLQRKANMIIYPNFVGYPTSTKLKKILFIYDISYITHSEFTHKLNQIYLSEWVPRSIDGSAKIITISQNAKLEIEQVYSVPGPQIEIIYPAVDHSVFYIRSASEIAAVKQKYGIHGNYILFAGTLEPRKNIMGVLDSYMKLPKTRRNKYSLVLAGGKGWNDDSIIKRLNQLQKQGESIIHTGYLPDKDFPPIYSGASVFVYPSFYEGFGMPPLEAMACGTPVITSDNSSLPEVVGNAGIMIKADDVQALAHQINRVLGDKKLANSMRMKGVEQAKKFTWGKSAQKLIDVLEEVDKS